MISKISIGIISILIVVFILTALSVGVYLLLDLIFPNLFPFVRYISVSVSMSVLGGFLTGRFYAFLCKKYIKEGPPGRDETNKNI